ncbi:MAG: tetratricopeptide repeat protein [Rhodobacteraceae bacterium]|nr:tetratricopeptide repeat protein [Paracoccaceae bacterium]
MKIIATIGSGLLGLSIATAALGAGDGNSSSTPTEAACKKKGMVLDPKTEKCVDAERGMFPDDLLYVTARGMAYDGQYQDAIRLLSLVQDQDDPRVLNYLGFSHRKLGDLHTALTYYQRALQIDPDYILARSYMGQGFVADGNIEAARAQLDEIRTRDGESSWAYVMLENALESRVTY